MFRKGIAVSSRWRDIILFSIYIQRGHAVAQLVETLRYKPEGRGLDSRWCH
jgi:hypothetical protein